jgi:two-component system KDP operon response regulator KdpE
MRPTTILVVDDEPALLRLVRATLQTHDYAVITAGSGEEALALVAAERPDLVVLDLRMPGIDGFETLRRLRLDSWVPVIMLTASAGDADRLTGFAGGADDYLTKPFNPDELVARVAAVLRRAAGGAPPLRYPGVEIDLERHRLTVDGAEVRLSRTEWELLGHLAANAGRTMRNGELLVRVWGPEFREESHYLRTWVSRLRAKLGSDPAGLPLITTFPGLGYRFEAPPVSANAPRSRSCSPPTGTLACPYWGPLTKRTESSAKPRARSVTARFGRRPSGEGLR